MVTFLDLEDKMGRLRRFANGLDDTKGFMKGGKIYKTISSISIAGIFVAVGILVFALTGYLKLSPALFGLVFSIAVLCMGLVTTLPWVRRIEKNQVKKLSFLFIGFIGLCALLWLIAIWVVVGLINAGDAITDNAIAGTMLFVQITVVLSMQLLISTFIGNMILRFGKELIPFQVVTGISYLFLDFYITFALLCIRINPAIPELTVAESISLLGSRFMITLLILSLAFMGVSAGVMKSIETRRIRHTTEILIDKNSPLFENVDGEQSSTQSTSEQNKESSQDRLEKLKNLYEQNLITEEEYNAKRADILKDM